MSALAVMAGCMCCMRPNRDLWRLPCPRQYAVMALLIVVDLTILGGMAPPSPSMSPPLLPPALPPVKSADVLILVDADADKRDRNDGRENWQESREKEIIIDLGKPQASGSMGQEVQPYLENHRHVVMMDIRRIGF